MFPVLQASFQSLFLLYSPEDRTIKNNGSKKGRVTKILKGRSLGSLVIKGVTLLPLKFLVCLSVNDALKKDND